MNSVQTFELIIGMFVAVLVLQYAAPRLQLPPAVALLVGGGALAFVPGLPAVRLDPELVLVRRLGQQRLDLLPLGIGQISRIAAATLKCELPRTVLLGPYPTNMGCTYP